MLDFVMPSGDLLVAPEAQEWVDTLLAKMSASGFAEKYAEEMGAFDSDGSGFWETGSSLRPYSVKEGVLTIPVKGMLMSGMPYALGGYATGYEYITAAVTRGVKDPEVIKIILDVDSPGGTVPGLFDCADAVFEARGDTPIHAVANESAYSAAYAIASSADTLTVARTGGVGSIGVLTTHRDVTEALAQMGVKITPIFAGKQKADGHPFVPLTAEAKARVQVRVDAIHDIFVSTVARNRGLDEQAVRDTEAGTFMAPEAIEEGLADAVGSLDSLSATADPFNQNEDEEMSNGTSVDQAEHETAVATATATATAAGNKAGVAEGANAERERVSTILGSAVAKIHPEAAQHLALNSDMAAAGVEALLSAMPVPVKAEAATEQGAGFTAAMENGDNPNLGAETNESDTPKASVPDGIFASAGFPPPKA